nr:hypothetical protein [Tanacetum cinerariifolium]
GFDNWKKVNDGKNCAFLKHIGCSQHRAVVAFSENLLNQDAHIESIIQKQNAELIFNNRVRLKASIDIVRWLTFQACAFRGHDETRKSKNRGNFIEMLKLLASYNVELAKVVLENAPFNSKYTSGDIQKEILSIIANKVRKHIRSEVGNSYFCVMVDEARDESKKEQMAIVLSEVIPVHQFFTKLSSIINVICASSKRHDELLKARSTEIERLLELGEIKHGRGKNQVGTLKRANDTRWGSHFYSVENLLRMFNSTRVVLESVIRDGYYSQRVDADAAYTSLKSFEFVFILHLMKEMMGRTDILSQALQKKNQDIGNAIDLVSATIESLNDFRNNGFNDHAMDLLTLGSALIPKIDSNGYNIDEICLLVEKYYPVDFTEQETLRLSSELEIFNIERSKNPKLISTATAERGFSAMKICKTRLRNRMSDDFLANSLVVYIEKEVAKNFDSDSIIDEFKKLKGRRADL